MPAASISRMSARRSRISSNTCWRSMGVPRSTWVSAGTEAPARGGWVGGQHTGVGTLCACARAKPQVKRLCEDAAMRAALLRQIPGKLEIDEVEVERARPPRGARSAPSRPACATPTCTSWRASTPTPRPPCSGHESAGVVEAVGDQVTYVAARRPRDHLPVRVLRQLRALPHRPPVAVPGQGRRPAAARRRAAPHPRRPGGLPAARHGLLRRADARPRARRS